MCDNLNDFSPNNITIDEFIFMAKINDLMNMKICIDDFKQRYKILYIKTKEVGLDSE